VLSLFGLNALWEWQVSPLFSHQLVDAVVRTLLFAVVAYLGVRRMHVSDEVDRLLHFRLGK
jgi:hypothetical protein